MLARRESSLDDACSPNTSQPLLHGKAMAQRTRIDVQPVSSLFKNVGALIGGSARRPTTAAQSTHPPVSAGIQITFPHVGPLPSGITSKTCVC